jgi:hypothetical protein
MLRLLLVLCCALGLLVGCERPSTPVNYLDDRAVITPSETPVLSFYRNVYPYYSGFVTMDGDRIFVMQCNHTEQLCYGPDHIVIGTVDEAAVRLPPVNQTALKAGRLICRDLICYDLRGRVIGTQLPFKSD